MDLDEMDDTAVTVWVARVNTGEKTIVTAWSWRDKSEAWCAHELEVDPDAVTWREGGGYGPGDHRCRALRGRHRCITHAGRSDGSDCIG